MEHDWTITGPRFRFRPVARGDQGFILSLRTNPTLNRWLNPTSGRIEDQTAWFERYLTRAGDWYFIIEAEGQPVGTIGLYEYDPAAGAAEWGRWILQPGLKGGVETAALMTDLAFSRLPDLQILKTRTVAGNHKVRDFYDRFGMARAGLLPEDFRDAEGQAHDQILFSLTREAWQSLRPGYSAVLP